MYVEFNIALNFWTFYKMDTFSEHGRPSNWLLPHYSVESKVATYVFHSVYNFRWIIYATNIKVSEHWNCLMNSFNILMGIISYSESLKCFILTLFLNKSLIILRLHAQLVMYILSHKLKRNGWLV